MLDAKSRLAGYILRPISLRPGGACVSGPEFLAALESEGLLRTLERRKVVLSVSPEQWHEGDLKRYISPNICFLFSLKDAPHWSADAWRAFVADVLAQGGRVAFDLPLFLNCQDNPACINSVLLDMQGVALAGFEQRLRTIARQMPGLELLVQGVATWDEFRFLNSLGVAFCIGAFATSRDESDQTAEIDQSRLVVVDMLNKLRADADLSVMANIAKRDPAVVLKLLQMANSPLSGLSRHVAALEEAIMFLGRDALYRWLSLALFRIGATSERDETLMVIALSRAAFMERLAPVNDRARADELFLVGLFSLMDRLLSMPVESVLEKIHLPEQVNAVLLHNEGPYVRFLLLAVAMERCRIDTALSLSALLGIDSSVMLDSYSQSMAWAQAGAVS